MYKGCLLIQLTL
jgi:SCY1-like protein 2